MVDKYSMSRHTLDGVITFRGHDFNMLIEIDYDAGNLDITEMRIYDLYPMYHVMHRRPSPRFIRNFQREKFDWLYAQCIDRRR